MVRLSGTTRDDPVGLPRETRETGEGSRSDVRSLSERRTPNIELLIAPCLHVSRFTRHMLVGKVTVPGWIARSLTGCRRVPIMLHSFVRVLRQGVIACRLHLSSHRTSRKNVNMDSVSG